MFGHAAVNDVKYLNLETKRYKLPSFSFRFADTQVLYMAMTETFDRQAGLESLTQIFEIDYTPHCAADDAYATMRIRAGDVRQRKLHPARTARKVQHPLRQDRQLSVQQLFVQPPHRISARKEPHQARTGRKARPLQRLRLRLPRPPADGRVAGQAVQLRPQHRRKFVPRQSLVKEIVRRGGRYSLKLSGCNAFVEEEGDDSVRCAAAHKLQEEARSQRSTRWPISAPDSCQNKNERTLFRAHARAARG